MKRLVMAMFLLVLVAAGIMVASWIGVKKRQLATRMLRSQAANSERIAKEIQAAALLENLKVDEAIELYEQLRKSYRDSESLSINLAIAKLKKVELLIERLKDGNADQDAVRKEIALALESGMKASRQAMEDQPLSETPFLVDIAFTRQRMFLLPVLAESLREDLIDQLRSYLRRFPDSVGLALEFDDLAFEMSLSSPELLVESIEYLFAAHRKVPRNVYVLSQLTRRLLEARDDRLGIALATLRNLVQPFYETMNMANPGSDFNAEKDSEVALQLVSQKKFDEATLILNGWLNVILKLGFFNSDKKLAQPDVLALLDLTDVNKAIRVQAETYTPDKVEGRYQVEEIPLKLPERIVEIRSVQWVDWDMDLQPDLLVLHQGGLSIFGISADRMDQPDLKVEVKTVDEGASAMLIDLFAVKFPNLPYANSATRRDSLLKTNPNMTELDADFILDRRHSLLRNLLVYSPSGIEIFQPTVGAPGSLSIGLEKVTSETGLEFLKNVTHVLGCDWDADGDLDLLVVSDGQPYFMQNNGNRTFVDMTYASDVKIPGRIRTIQSCDYDRDIDVDFLVVLDNEQVGVFENLLHGQFRYRKLDGLWSRFGTAQSLCAAELDGNASWDWIALTPEGTLTLTTQTPMQNQVTPKIGSALAGPARSLIVGDFNLDSWEDILVASERGVKIYYGMEGGIFDVDESDTVSAKEARLVDAVDWNSDGVLDFVMLSGGQLTLCKGKSTGNFNNLRIRVLGTDDASGGGRVNHFAIGSTLEVFTKNRYLAKVIRSDETHFGLGGEASYNVRIVFTNGLTQNVVDPPTNSIVEEKQIPKGSCPFLYGWDGEKWCFITDLLWNAPLGLQVAKGVTLPDRRWEYLRVPGEQMVPHQGAYEIRITEELWEAAYFDHVQLIAVDHPLEFDIHTNEKVGPAEIAEPRIWTTLGRRPVVSAKDHNQRDWSDALRAADGIYVDDLGAFVVQGVTDPHYLELDLGTLDRNEPGLLFLTGWLFPSDTSLNIKLDQDSSRSGATPPSLWAPDASGEFQVRLPFMGFPGGKPKTIVVDLKDAFEVDDFRVRIVTSSEIYWDEAFVVPGPLPQVEYREVPLRLLTAELRERGFSAVTTSVRSQPHRYDYQSVSLRPSWPPMEGLFTRFGSVTELVAEDDDRMVVMGAGDEMVIRFEIPNAPIPDGWKRDFILHCVGWDKDADLNTLEGQSSLPLPFKNMKRYPPPAEQWEEAQAVDALNRDQLTRRYRFRSFWSAYEGN